MNLADLIAAGVLDYMITQIRLCINSGQRNCYDEARQMTQAAYPQVTNRNLSDLERRSREAIQAGQTYRNRSDGYVYDFNRVTDEVRGLRDAGYRGTVVYRFTATVTFQAVSKSGQPISMTRVVDIISPNNPTNAEIRELALAQLQTEANDWLSYGGRFASDFSSVNPLSARIEAARRTLQIQ